MIDGNDPDSGQPKLVEATPSDRLAPILSLTQLRLFLAEGRGNALC
ncbi:hypothetical protein K4A83_06580 [Spirulina subsalsa FACHB-351]|uniref:Uncharacterized protein n=1 Tax=Spirulina subsalsa FACHB-351 TaxID=234711 RepID=A0ABT3L423_9CYAN|nr:hypothetical protein [Spirulina subsalsa]MCW6035937.1 hypothetical protein [Spirulina subsalsa FACHB-351]